MKKKQAKGESRLVKGFGAVNPHNRPEDWTMVREEVETLIAEDAAIRGQQRATEDSGKAEDEDRS